MKLWLSSLLTSCDRFSFRDRSLITTWGVGKLDARIQQIFRFPPYANRAKISVPPYANTFVCMSAIEILVLQSYTQIGSPL